jgi:hypothetical protein
MPLKALLCSGNNALPQHWSVLRAMHTLNSLKNYLGVVVHPFNVFEWIKRPHVGHKGGISIGGGHSRLWLCWLMMAVGG